MPDALPAGSGGLAAAVVIAVVPAGIAEIAVVIVAGIVMKMAVLAKGEKVPVASATPAERAFAVARCNCAKGYPPWGPHSRFHS